MARPHPFQVYTGIDWRMRNQRCMLSPISLPFHVSPLILRNHSSSRPWKQSLLNCAATVYCGERLPATTLDLMGAQFTRISQEIASQKIGSSDKLHKVLQALCTTATSLCDSAGKTLWAFVPSVVALAPSAYHLRGLDCRLACGVSRIHGSNGLTYQLLYTLHLTLRPRHSPSHPRQNFERISADFVLEPFGNEVDSAVARDGSTLTDFEELDYTNLEQTALDIDRYFHETLFDRTFKIDLNTGGLMAKVLEAALRKSPLGRYLRIKRSAMQFIFNEATHSRTVSHSRKFDRHEESEDNSEHGQMVFATARQLNTLNVGDETQVIQLLVQLYLAHNRYI